MITATLNLRKHVWAHTGEPVTMLSLTDAITQDVKRYYGSFKHPDLWGADWTHQIKDWLQNALENDAIIKREPRTTPERAPQRSS